MLDHDPLLTYRVAVAALVGSLIVGELSFVAFVKGKSPSIRTTLTDCSIFAVNLAERGMTLGLRLAVFMALASLAPVTWGVSVASVVVAYILVDFVYYWKHRLFHATRIGWALHATHHSSRSLNFLATFRINWIEAAVSYVFFAPLALLGFDPWLLLVLVEVNDGWQFVCHTELRNPFRGLERWFNTPNIHRVHHAKNSDLQGRNFGSTFMIWDRLFGTYHPGLNSVESGVEGIPRSAGVLELQFGSVWRLLNRSETKKPSPASRQ
jgi:sterol desaturase/sphingolipid hydroxylase (fatty acid hydroxylase superfamily)